MSSARSKKIIITGQEPVLPGTVSTAQSTCGKPNCACKARPPKLHGVYHRWTGIAEGKRTTITLTKEEAQECQRRIQNYHHIKNQVDKLLHQGLKRAPWKNRPQK
ncbi:hypothetical protein SBV1_340049 [Verrucomicrobia bacterium]|nr:hypothetical protein SBV1_340049 [Verrucomicrobiota bacterium]